MASSSGNNCTRMSVLPVKEDPKPLLKDVNHFLICVLCGGYFVDATTIVDCLHTYCRSCIVKFLHTSKFCPICDCQVHRTKPHLSLKHDATMQRLVYKAVPGLYKNELLRRKSYITENGEESNQMDGNDSEMSREYYFAPDEPISICLEYVNSWAANSCHSDKIDKCIANEHEQITHRKYLNCPAALKIRHIYKFIKLKYNLKQSQEVVVSYDNTKLPGYFSLMDVAYTFSWERDNPMRLCYQILERATIRVPRTASSNASNESVLVKNDSVTSSSSSQNGISTVAQGSDESRFRTKNTETHATKLNLKRKVDATPLITSINSVIGDTNGKQDKEEFGLPSVKIPRIVNTKLKDMMDKKGTGEEKVKPTATVSPCMDNGFKLQIKHVNEDALTDDFIKYEQDIEEVDDDDDDDEDRLRISDDKVDDNADQQSAVDNSDLENGKDDDKDETVDGDVAKKSAKYKRKNKKSKHHHHHKHHHHRHHERKKQSTPQATILHSPDTDIMKLKFKLNNVKPDVKYHKQRRKRKKSPDSYFSSSYSCSSSASSVSGSSPDTRGASRADDDSLHSHVSELSTESVEVVSSKEEATPVKPEKSEESVEKYKSPTSKEKLLQMRAFRPKNIAIVKPEENKKLEKQTEKLKEDNKLSNGNVNNSNTKASSSTSITNDKEGSLVVETAEKAKATPAVLRPPSSLTVSKITTAERLQMEQKKLMKSSNDDKPRLEIIMVNGPISSSNSFTLPTSTPTTSGATSTVANTAAKPKPPVRRPPPAAIPLVQYQKMKSNEQNLPKSLTMIPQMQRAKSTNDAAKKVKDALSIGDGANRSVTIPLSGNTFDNDFMGALDLSGRALKYSDKTINVAQSLLHKKPCMNGAAIRPPPNGVSSYSPVKCMNSMASNLGHVHEIPTSDGKLVNKYPIIGSPKHKMTVSSPQSSPKHTPTRMPGINKTVKGNVPKLNEIKIGPVSSATEAPPKPGPNQAVRQIPNPSMMLQRHQATSIASNGHGDYIGVRLPASTTIMSHRIVSNTCSLSTLKKGDKCPPAIPLKGYLDVSSVMATK